MKFNTHNNEYIDIKGTFLVGIIDISCDELYDKFGHADLGDDKDIDIRWSLKFEDGTVATIYNWQNGEVYYGFNGMNLLYNREWHIGGFDGTALHRVKEALMLK